MNSPGSSTTKASVLLGNHARLALLTACWSGALALLCSSCSAPDMAHRAVTYSPKPPSAGFQCLESVSNSENSRIAYLEYGSGGDLLRGEQLVVARHALRKLQSHGRPVIMVAYVHGWKHGSLSADAFQFRKFIEHLASIGNKRNFDVMGVICTWPGAFWGPLKQMNAPECKDLEPAFPAASLVSWVPEQFTVWDRYTVAYHVAEKGNLTQNLKDLTRQLHHADDRSISVCVGHSMGAFILELGVVKEMVKEDRNGRSQASPDLVFLMNSAAPAILANRVVEEWKTQKSPVSPAVPRVVSITSDGDWATGRIAPAGFVLGPANPMMRSIWNDCEPQAHEWPDMVRCPGHTNHLLTWYTNLVNQGEPAPACGRVPDPSDRTRDWFFGRNLRLEKNSGEELPARTFLAFDGRGNSHLWHFNWNHQRLGPCENLTPYWVVQTGRSLICDHGDIWDTQAVSVMTAAIHESGIIKRSH